MPRKRSLDPTKAINITLPLSLLNRVHEQLSHEASRSQWIAGAIRARLDKSQDIQSSSTKQLMAAIHARKDINGEQRGIIEYWINQMN